MSGHYRMARGWQEHKLFRNEPYSKRDAWVWLIENAAWKPKAVKIDRHPVQLERGDLSFSERFLATKWGWARSRVHRFIEDLVAWDMISARSAPVQKTEHQSDHPQNILTICNYGKYQDARTISEPSSEPYVNHTRTIPEPKKKEGKEVKEDNPPTPLSVGGVIDFEFAEFWRSYPRRDDRKNALKAFKRARTKADQPTIVAAAKSYAAKRAGQDPQFTALAATWLNGERWADEAAAPVQKARDYVTAAPGDRPTPEELRAAWQRMNFPRSA